jgi:hypothetical protein
MEQIFKVKDQERKELMKVLGIITLINLALIALAVVVHLCHLYLPRKYKLYYTNRYGKQCCWEGKIPLPMQLGIDDVISKYGHPTSVSLDLNKSVMYLSIPAENGWYQYNVYRNGDIKSGHGYDKHGKARSATQWINGMVTYYDSDGKYKSYR